MNIISRKQAKAKGLKFYFTGKPCPHGHFVEKYVSNRWCIVCCIQKSIEQAKGNPEKRCEVQKKWIEKNPEYPGKWNRKNKDKKNTYTANRRAAELQRTPSWADLELIKVFYIEAARLTKEIGVQYDVDHIVPLQNRRKVCGLHVENNLQVITHIANCEKGNKLCM